MTLPFGWCSDDLHESCRDVYTIMWPPMGFEKKDKIEQVEKTIECSCPCHGRVVAAKTETPTPRQAAKKKPQKKQEPGSRQ